MNMLKVVAHNVRSRRSSLGLKQDQLADKAGVSRPAIARVENASNPGLKILDLFRIAEALRCKTSDLLYVPTEHAVLCAAMTLKPGPCDCGFETFRRLSG